MPEPDGRIPAKVSVVDFDMPFWSIVILLVKWSIAAIPALIILGIIASVLFAVLAGIGVALNPFLRSNNAREKQVQRDDVERERLRRVCEESSPSVRATLEACKDFR